MARKTSISNSLFWKISFIFLFMMAAVGVAYVFVTQEEAEKHFMEKNQRLNAKIAESIIHEVKPFLNGKKTEAATDEIMHHMMAINPIIEVYLLDPEGEILNYVAPYKKVKMTEVNLEPILKFMDYYDGLDCIVGDDPRNPGMQKVFSAAPVIENEELLGYVYVILASEEYDTVTSTLKNSFLLNLGAQTMLITLLTTLIIGLVAIWLITKNLRAIISTVRSFQSGNMKARIPQEAGKGELNLLADSFNEMADTIEGNIENLKAMENLRRELVGNVSHDLRTPLAVIHGYIETLMIKNEHLSIEDRKKYLNTIFESTEKLKKLVEELFELSKLEAKQISPKKEPFYINELIQDISQKYELTLKQKNIILEPVFESDIMVVEADIALIERVLQNLIDNAIKFTPDGGKVTIATNEKDSYVEIRVSDTGKGIPEEQIPFVFDRYHIGDKRLSLDNQNTGLGLAIVKKILEIHDATIKLTSKLNQGTSFAFQLPQYRNGY